MATRRKKTARRSAARKTRSKKRPARRKAAQRPRSKPKASGGGPPRKSAARKGAKKPVRKKRAGKKTARRRTGVSRPSRASALDALARKIVRATNDPSRFQLSDLYQENCVSREAAGPPASGIAGIEAKLAQWNTVQEGSTWKARNVLTRGNTICIEWQAKVKLRGGPVVNFEEIAVHEVKNGKIASERYYYDPASLAPQPEAQDAPAAEQRELGLDAPRP